MIITRGLGSNLIITQGYGGVLVVTVDPYCPMLSPYTFGTEHITPMPSPYAVAVSAISNGAKPITDGPQYITAMLSPYGNGTPYGAGTSPITSGTSPISKSQSPYASMPKACG